MVEHFADARHVKENTHTYTYIYILNIQVFILLIILLPSYFGRMVKGGGGGGGGERERERERERKLTPNKKNQYVSFFHESSRLSRYKGQSVKIIPIQNTGEIL